MNPPIVTAELAHLGDRELWEATFRLVKEMNGSVKQLNHDFYGDPAHGTVGMKQEVEQVKAKVDCVEDMVDRLRAAMRVAWAIVGAVGVGVLTVLSILVGAA